MRIDDIFNRLIANEIYLEKYLPYNTFVQFCEIIHVSLEPKQLKKLEDYENAKMQNYLAEILLDLGRDPIPIDRKKVEIPYSDKSKPLDCECSIKDFRNILGKQV